MTHTTKAKIISFLLDVAVESHEMIFTLTIPIHSQNKMPDKKVIKKFDRVITIALTDNSTLGDFINKFSSKFAIKTKTLSVLSKKLRNKCCLKHLVIIKSDDLLISPCVQALNEITYGNATDYWDFAMDSFRKARGLFKKEKNLKGEAFVYLEMSYFSADGCDSVMRKNSLFYCERALKLCELINNKFLTVYIHLHMGGFYLGWHPYRTITHIKTARKHYEKGEQLYYYEQDWLGVAKALEHQGDLEAIVGSDKAMQFYRKAEKFYEKAKNPVRLAFLLCDIAWHFAVDGNSFKVNKETVKINKLKDLLPSKIRNEVCVQLKDIKNTLFESAIKVTHSRAGVNRSFFADLAPGRYGFLSWSLFRG